MRCAKYAPLALAWGTPSSGRPQLELVTLPGLDSLARWDELALFGTAISSHGEWAASITGEQGRFFLTVYRLAGGRQVGVDRTLPRNPSRRLLAPWSSLRMRQPSLP